MLNHFREPQKAVLSIQQDLDEHQPNAALFIDMAKAFEKVNKRVARGTAPRGTEPMLRQGRIGVCKPSTCQC